MKWPTSHVLSWPPVLPTVGARRNSLLFQEVELYISSRTAQGVFVGADGPMDLAALCAGDGASAARRDLPVLLKRPRGRPKGTKDSKPRKVET